MISRRPSLLIVHNSLINHSEPSLVSDGVGEETSCTIYLNWNRMDTHKRCRSKDGGKDSNPLIFLRFYFIQLIGVML